VADIGGVSGRVARKQLFESRYGIQIHSRSEYLGDLRDAIQTDKPCAVGRLGISEKHWMYYPLLLQEQPNSAKRRVFEIHLLYHGLSQVGIFPGSPSFYLKYNDFFIESIRQMDWLGLVLEPVLDPKLVRYYNLVNKLIYYTDVAPDKSAPSNRDNCYLSYFAGKRILIICPFGKFLQAQATQERFERVWSKTKTKWFFPAEVDAVEFPYGFESETQRQFPTALDLFESIRAEIAKKDFDIALIAAAGLAVPLAAFVKSIGKVAIDLGGDLQFLFGVMGNRWRSDERMKEKYFNEWWVEVPAKYRPTGKGVAGDQAFW
jgi:hypothetical protein